MKFLEVLTQSTSILPWGGKALQQNRGSGRGLGVSNSQALKPGIFGEVGRAWARNSHCQTRSWQRGPAFELVGGLSKGLMGSKDQHLGQGGVMAKQGGFGGWNSEREQNFSATYVGPTGSHGSRSGEVEGVEKILVFPSISTLDFQFDMERASSVVVEIVSEFLSEPEYSELRLMMIDLTDSDILKKVRKKALDRGLDPHRFFTHVGDMTKLRSRGGPACKVITNAANSFLRPGGGGTNLDIYNAAGPEILDRATKAVKQSLKPGEGILVSLPQSSPLYKREGVTHVIQVLGPNMNRRRPYYLDGNYYEGCKQLRDAYRSLFKNFVLYAFQNVAGFGKGGDVRLRSTSQNPRESASSAFRGSASGISSEGASGASRESASGASRESAAGASRESASGGFDADVADAANLSRKSAPAVVMPAVRKNLDSETSTGKSNNIKVIKKTIELRRPEKRSSQVQKKWEPWTLTLFDAAMHPEQHTDVIVQSTDDAVVIHDAHPKAKQHVLVISRMSGLDGIADLQPVHVPLLKRMHTLGEEWAASLLKLDPSLTFRLGYHSVPYMRQLHLNVISHDFDSTHLKNKKHWNSFTTSFFLDSVEVIRRLEEKGDVQITEDEAEAMLESELRCHRCRGSHKSFPQLKQHISTCSQPLPMNPHLIVSGGNFA